MTITTIPNSLRSGSVTKLLDEFRTAYLRLARNSELNGIVVADQDAKVLAVNSFFDSQLNYWDIGAIGAALHGVAKQAGDFFAQGDLERSSLIFSGTQFFVHSIGNVELSDGRIRELIFILLGGKTMNIGLAIMQMRKFAPQIQHHIEESERAQSTMVMNEQEFMEQIENLKQSMFNI